MSRRYSLFAVITTLVLFVAGFIFLNQDPYGSKTMNSGDNNQVQTQQPVPSFTPPIYTDDMDGNNDTTALKLRGYKVWYRGGGPQGSTATWFQGNNTVFPAFNGPATGYVAANYNAVTGTNNIDSWLVLPWMSGGIQVGDSLYFYSRAPAASTFPDSIRVMCSVSDSVPEGTWVELGRFKVNTNNAWERKGFRSTVSGPLSRFAIRYNVVGGGPGGNNSDYIGIDAIQIVRSASPTVNYYSSQWCAATTLPNIPAASLYNACAWLGDTLYMHAPDGTGTAVTTIQRYAWGGGWSTGVPLPIARTQGTLTRCGNTLYFIGGSATAGGAGATEVWSYTPATGWVSKAPLPVGLNGHASVCWGDSVIFAIMGPWGTPSTGVYAYRVGSNTWITSTAFTGAARRSHAAGLWGNKIYVSNGFPFSNTFYIGTIGANASTITWVAGPPMPLGGAITGRSRVGGVAYGDKFYVVGGNNSTGVPTSSDSTCVWNINAGLWTVIPGKPAAVHNNEAAVTYKLVGDTVKIFCPGGSNQAATTLNFDYLGCGPVVTGVEPGVNQTPTYFKLSQNYPNPFNPTTKITYALPRADNVKLTVYDILGREVAVIVNEFKTAGVYAVEFNATNLSSGVYFYRISTSEFTDVKKMLLVK